MLLHRYVGGGKRESERERDGGKEGESERESDRGRGGESERERDGGKEGESERERDRGRGERVKEREIEGRREAGPEKRDRGKGAEKQQREDSFSFTHSYLSTLTSLPPFPPLYLQVPPRDRASLHVVHVLEREPWDHLHRHELLGARRHVHLLLARHRQARPRLVPHLAHHARTNRPDGTSLAFSLSPSPPRRFPAQSKRSPPAVVRNGNVCVSGGVGHVEL